MGIFDKLREFFNGKENQQSGKMQTQNSDYEKTRLCNQIEELSRRIAIKDSFNSKISNISAYQLKTKDFDELNRIYLDLEKELSAIEKRIQGRDSRREDLEATKWTGKKREGMTDHDLDWMQR